ncbi:hypothetical protein GS426_16390 [Rhodococcus hoagii]|nr:hypothetical protein [Prescottella equi]
MSSRNEALVSKGGDLPPASAGLTERSGHEPDPGGHWGVYGGRHVPEALMAVIEEVTAEYEKARADDNFLDELDRLQRDYTGRPSPIFEATRLREHAAARASCSSGRPEPHRSHKINNVLGQVLLAKRMGKTRIIAETGAGQHASRRRPRVPCSGSSASSTWVRSTRPAGPQRRPDASARRRGRLRRIGFGHFEGRDQRGRCATGSPTQTARTTVSAPRPARTRSR